MRPPALRLHRGLIVDNFAGGGGASLGIEWALGRSPDLAVNHDREAIAMHELNHPETRHFCEDVFDIDPRAVCGGQPIALAWFSPDCTYHSKARGGKPFRDRDRARRLRGLAWVVVKWANLVRPRVIILENVEEFAHWGPLLEDGKPDPAKRGLTFRRWWAQLENAGYVLEMKQLRACDYGAPTTRKRLFIIARCDGRPIVWPAPTHGPGTSSPYRTAAECIEWSVPTRSIFGRPKPLADNTLRRIGRGIWRYTIDAAEPFVVPTTHAGDTRVHAIGNPLPTITAAHRGELALVAPSLIQTGYGERKGQLPRCLDIQKPLGTIISGGNGGNGKHALVAAFLAKHYGGHEGPGATLAAPLATITATDHHGLVTASMLKLYGTCADGQPMTTPFPTIRAQGTHLAEVRAFLVKYNRTGTAMSIDQPIDTIVTRDRFGLVYVSGEPYEIADIGMRMLIPRELFRGQSFPDSYQIVPVIDGKPLSKEGQTRMCGNSVSPIMACALVSANVDRSEVVAA